MATASLAARLGILLSLLWCACGDDLVPAPEADDEGTGLAATPGVAWLDGTEVDAERLAAWIRAGGYQVWERSSDAFRSSAGGGSRVYVNAVLAQSLSAGARSHPAGSIGVREVTFDDLITLRGVNVLVKLEEGTDEARNWLFVELFDLEPGGAPSVFERGASSCLPCHSAAPDFVRSAWPLP